MELSLGFFYGILGSSLVWCSSCRFWVLVFYVVRGGFSNGVLQVGLTMFFFLLGWGLSYRLLWFGC